MLDQILNFVKEQTANNVTADHGLDEQQKDGVFEVAQNSVTDSLKGQAMSGNLSGLMDLFNGNADTDHNSNPVAGGMMQNLVSGLMNKFGFDESKAGGIANQIVPAIVKRFASPETGNATDAGDLVKKIGLDGDNGIMDIVSKFTGGGNGGGGIMDTVKGLFDGK
ncbi:MAG: hypothetical protein ACKVOK_02210 [Flavobacteriales bacterium]